MKRGAPFPAKIAAILRGDGVETIRDLQRRLDGQGPLLGQAYRAPRYVLGMTRKLANEHLDAVVDMLGEL